jgi:hypothetical protein
MAFVDTLGIAADPSNPLFNTGVNVRVVQALITITSGSADGEVQKLAIGLPIDAQVLGLFLPGGAPGITQLTDVDFGFYRNADGVVIDKDILVDGKNFSSAITTAIDCLADNSGMDYTKKIKDLLSLESDTEPSGGVDLCATINTQGSGTGTIRVWVVLGFPA